MPYSSAVWETKAIERSERRPASRKARASSSVTATPVASSKAAPNQPSWWPATTSGAPRRRLEHDSDQAVQLRRVLLADRHARRSFHMPDAVEGTERVRRLVERAAGRAVDDHGLRAAQAELEADVIRPEAGDLPLDQRDLAGEVDAGAPLAATASH